MIYSQAKALVQSQLIGPPSEWQQITVERAIQARRHEAASVNVKGWAWLLRHGYARNSGGYETGSLQVTQDSVAVTGNGTAWTSSMVGWRIGSQNVDQEVYTVKAVADTTHLTLNRPFEGATDTALTYRMHDPYCRCPNDLLQWESITIEVEGRQLAHASLAGVRGVFPKQITFGGGYVECLGPPTKVAAYSTGTVAVTAATATVALTGGTWPQWSADRHLRISGESALYKVKTRDSDLLLTLDRPYGGHNAGSGKTYELDPPGALQLEVHYPREDQYAIKIDYYSQPEELVNDADLLEGPEGYGSAIVDMATSDCLWGSIDHDRMSQSMVEEIGAKAQMLERRGTSGLAALMMSGAPEPQQDAVMTDIRYARRVRPWSVFNER